MEHDSLFLEKEPTFTYKISHRKGAVATCIAIVVIAYLLFLFCNWWLGESILFVAVPVLFLLAGISHLAVLDKNLSTLTDSERWLFTACLSVALLVLLSTSSLWGVKLQWSRVFAGVGAFFLPFVVAELWRLHATISYSGAIPWQAKQGPSTEFPSIYLNGIPVRFRIIQEPQEKGISTIPFLASGRMLLGDVFSDMVQKQNKKGQPAVALHSHELEPYTWIFYTDDLLFWNRPLDPNSSLVKNRVRNNAVIYVQQVSKESFHPHSEKTREQNLVS